MQARDTQALRLGRQIKVALELAGITVSDELGGTNGTLGGAALGIEVDGPDSGLVNGIATALVADGHLKAEANVVQPKISVGPLRAINGIIVGANL